MISICEFTLLLLSVMLELVFVLAVCVELEVKWVEWVG